MIMMPHPQIDYQLSISCLHLPCGAPGDQDMIGVVLLIHWDLLEGDTRVVHPVLERTSNDALLGFT